MRSPFDALDAQVSDALEGAFGETVRLIPRTSRRGAQYVAAGADPDRPPTDFIAVPTEASKVADTRGQRTGYRMGSATRMIVGRFEMWVSAATVAAMPVEIREGDIVRMTEWDDEPTFNVVNAIPEAFGDLRLTLSAEEMPE